MNPKSPSGGYQEGGWYEGKQAWKDAGGNWTFSQPGQINPLSNQIGAGQAVSEEVVRQTNPNNVAFIQQEQKKQQQNPVNPFAQVTPQQQPAQGFNQAQTTGTAGASGVGTITPQPTINLPEMYKNLYAKSGVSEIEKQYSDMEKKFIEAKAKINDNPFLSEATRVGRVAKLESLFNERTANIKNDIATKKADIETQLNLETKQFDINSQAAQQALSQFNTLLGMGALDGASGEDIANLTRSTGISSQMINSAIQANKDKNVSTSTMQFDDGTNEGFVVINDKTGEIIAKQVIGASKPKGGSGEPKRTDFVEMLKQDAQSGLTLSQIFAIYSGYLDPDEILQLYNSSSKYGPDKGSISNLGKYGVTQPKSSSSDIQEPNWGNK